MGRQAVGGFSVPPPGALWLPGPSGGDAAGGAAVLVAVHRAQDPGEGDWVANFDADWAP